jgi:hypothetical protein
LPLAVGAGRPDGTFPQLAGQHTSVLIKQMADIRAGVRDNPTMYPFAATLTDPQELADVAAFIEQGCVSRRTWSLRGQGRRQASGDRQGTLREGVQGVPRSSGEGSKDKVLSGDRRSALQVPAAPDDRNPRRSPPQRQPGHGQNHQKYDNDQLVAISAYQSSLVMPGNMCKAKAPARKK